MANEGEASVKIVGDVRDFARQVERDLNRELKKIKLDPVQLSVDGDYARASGEQAGRDIGDGIADGATEAMRSNESRFRNTGDQIGKVAGQGAGRSFVDPFRKAAVTGFLTSAREGVKSFNSEVKKGLGKAGNALSAIGDFGKQAVSLLGKALSGAASVVVPVASAIGTAIGGTILVALAAVIGPGIASVVAAALTAIAGIGLGAGLIGLGAFFVRETDQAKKAFKDLGETFKGVSREAAKPILKPLVKEINGIRELIRQLKPEFTSIFKSLAPALGPLNDSLGKFVGSLVRGIKDSMPGITAALDGFGRGLEYTGQVLGDFFRTIFSNEDLIDNTTEGFMRFISGPLTLLGPLISGLNVIFGVFNNAVRLMAEENIFGRIGEQILAFVDGGTGALGRISEAWGPLGQAIQNVWDKLKAFAAEDDAGKLSMRWSEVVEAMKQAWGPLKEFLGTVWEEAVAFIKRVWDEQFIPWWEGTAEPWLREAIKSAFSAAWDAAVSVAVSKLNEMINTTMTGIRTVAGRVRSGLTSIPGYVREAFRSAHTGLLQVMGNMVSTAYSKAREIISRIRGALNNIRNTVTGAFSGASGWLRSAGSNIINGLISGIQAGFGRVRGLLNQLTGMLPDWKGPADVDRKILRESGRLVMQGFEQGLRDQQATIRRTLQGLTGDMPGWTGSALPSARSSAPAGGTVTIMPGAIVINGNGAGAGNAAAEAVLLRLAQAGMVR